MLCSSPPWLGSCSTDPPALSVVGAVLVEGGPHRGVGPRWPGLWSTACFKHPDVPAGGVKQGVVGALDPSATSRQRVVHPVTLATRGRLDVRQVGLVLSPWTFHACNDVAGVHGAHSLRSRGRQLGCWQCSRGRITSSE